MGKGRPHAALPSSRGAGTGIPLKSIPPLRTSQASATGPGKNHPSGAGNQLGQALGDSFPSDITKGFPITLPSPNRRQDGTEEELEREILELLTHAFSFVHPMRLKELLETIEAKIISSVLSGQKGDLKKAAKILGIKYTTLYAKTRRYGIEPILYGPVNH